MRWFTLWLNRSASNVKSPAQRMVHGLKKRQSRGLTIEELEGRVLLSTSAIVASTSTNWSGYAEQTSLNSPQSAAVTAVGGTWAVPAVTGTATGYSSVWVGIDGYSSPTVEQLGTEEDISSGKPVYYAWYEMYPSNSVIIPSSRMAIAPGDIITAEVSYNAGVFTLAMMDTPKNGGPVEFFSITQKASRAQTSSAEWIVEAPSSSNVLPMANFGTVNFSNAYATISGRTGPIDSSSGQAAQIDMLTSGRAQVTQDTTGSLTDAVKTVTGSLLPPAGTTVSSFSVTYTAPTTSTPAPQPGRHHHTWWALNQPGVFSAFAAPSIAPAAPHIVTVAPLPVPNAPNTPEIHAPVAQIIGPAAVATFGAWHDVTDAIADADGDPANNTAARATGASDAEQLRANLK